MGLKFVNVFKKLIPKREIPRTLTNGKMVWANPEHPDYDKLPPKPKLPRVPPRVTKMYAHATCPNCNANLLSGDVFCNGCGCEIAEMYKDTQIVEVNDAVPEGEAWLVDKTKNEIVGKITDIKKENKPKGKPSDAPDITSDRRIGDGVKKKVLVHGMQSQTSQTGKEKSIDTNPIPWAKSNIKMTTKIWK